MGLNSVLSKLSCTYTYLVTTERDINIHLNISNIKIPPKRTTHSQILILKLV